MRLRSLDLALLFGLLAVSLGWYTEHLLHKRRENQLAGMLVAWVPSGDAKFIADRWNQYKEGDLTLEEFEEHVKERLLWYLLLTFLERHNIDRFGYGPATEEARELALTLGLRSPSEVRQAYKTAVGFRDQPPEEFPELLQEGSAEYVAFDRFLKQTFESSAD